MKISIIQIDETDEKWISEGILKYTTRLDRYLKLEIKTIKISKATRQKSIQEQKNEEGKKIISLLEPGDFVILLDENGDSFNSKEFAETIRHHQNYQRKNLFFIIGGPYGFSNEVYNRAEKKMQLSQMTFSHQMIRPFFFEQLYRAFTILKGEKYHHD